MPTPEFLSPHVLDPQRSADTATDGVVFGKVPLEVTTDSTNVSPAKLSPTLELALTQAETRLNHPTPSLATLKEIGAIVEGDPVQLFPGTPQEAEELRLSIIAASRERIAANEAIRSKPTDA